VIAAKFLSLSLFLSFDFAVIANPEFAMYYRIYFPFSSWECSMHSYQTNFLPLLSFRATKFCWILICQESGNDDVRSSVVQGVVACTFANQCINDDEEKRKKEREKSEEARQNYIMQSRKIFREHANVTSELKSGF